jgi:hypothetical protein
MAKKVYIVGNYLYIDDLETGKRISGSRALFELVSGLITGTSFTVLKDKQAVATLVIGDTLDENDVLFTLAGLQAFKEAGTGFKLASGSGAYTQAQVDKATRMTLTPYKLVTYLPVSTSYTTPSLPAGTPTKVLIPTTVKTINSFGIVDLGGGDLAYQFQGAETAIFELSLSTGVIAGTNNTILAIEAYKNGILEPGAGSVRKLSSADVGNITITGEVTLSPMDTLAIYVTSTLTSTVTFSRTSIQVVERN